MNALTRLALYAAVAAAPDMGSSAAATEPSNAELRRLVDEHALIRIVDQIDRAVDAQDWKLARGYFAERVRVDFSSLSGQPETIVPADDLIAGWAGNLKASKTSLHLRTNHDVSVDGDRATVKSNATPGTAWRAMATRCGKCGAPTRRKWCAATEGGKWTPLLFARPTSAATTG
ncbi:nuclear transport factor 2 family protein [Mesorhizobium amorphae]|uniref:nuclear transport factor 2 family protein n=1 Tax=Mesorhizobium amorphae TaxID=71433 RepID=UPI0021B28685|nr:nuclear transport factor 2 family protein [Mesorhizobium amorphae]